MFTESSLKSHYLTAVQIYFTSVCVNLCTLLVSKASLPSHTMRMIFLYIIFVWQCHTVTSNLVIKAHNFACTSKAQLFHDEYTLQSEPKCNALHPSGMCINISLIILHSSCTEVLTIIKFAFPVGIVLLLCVILK